MNHSAAAKPEVGVLLSGGEKFSPYYGGALARWTFEVYNRLRLRMDATVFGFPTAPQDLYPLYHQTNRWWRACDWLKHIPFARRYNDALWLRSLSEQLRGRDILHVHNRPQWVGLLRHFGYRGAIVLHLQNNHIGHWSGPMLDALAQDLDSLAVCSTFLRDVSVEKSAALAAKTRVVFNGANLRLFFPREEVREPKTIFFVGRFDPGKGVLQLVEAYAKVLRDHPDAGLVIGGATGFGVHQETGYVRRVRELANQIRQSHNVEIQFPGYIDHDHDLPLWFQRATIFVCPSLFQEPFGLVNAEAMACATPVVGARRGGIPEVLGDAGLVVEPEDTDEVASMLSHLLSQPTVARDLGRAGCERCRTLFDWDVVAAQWGALLEGLM